MKHSAAEPFVESQVPKKSFCLKIVRFYCLEPNAGLSDDIFFTKSHTIILIFDILPSHHKRRQVRIHVMEWGKLLVLMARASVIPH